MPRRARYLVPRGLPRRDEILAVCVVVAVLVHVLFAQLTILLAAVLYLITKVTRWRLSWLTVPAAAGLAWTVAAGPRGAAAGFTARPGRIVAARRAATVRAIRTGGVVTRDGGCLGVAAGSGARVTLSWAEAAG